LERLEWGIFFFGRAAVLRGCDLPIEGILPSERLADSTRTANVACLNMRQGRLCRLYRFCEA
jgi:hypothetical protein